MSVTQLEPTRGGLPEVGSRLVRMGLLATLAAFIGIGTVLDLPLTVAILVSVPFGLLLLYVLLRGLRFPLTLLYLVLLVTPFHTIATNMLTLRGMSPRLLDLISIWKEVVILTALALLAGNVLIKHRRVPRSTLLPLYLSFMGLALAYVFLSPEIYVGAFQFRNLAMGLPVLLSLYLLRPRTDCILPLLDVVIVQGILFTGIAVYQVYLSDFYTFLIRFGFVPPGTSWYQVRHYSQFTVSGQYFWRANSIFVGPNEFGLFLAILIVMVCSTLLFSRPQLGKWRCWFYALALPALLAGEFMTMSRNSWVLLAMAGITLVLKLKLRYQVLLAAAAVAVVVAMLLFVPPLQRFVVGTLTLQDSSAAGRVAELDRNLSNVLEKPLGRGLGVASYKTLRFDFTPIPTEYFLFMMAIEVGIPGLLWYLFVMSQFGLACSSRGWRSSGLGRALGWGASGLIFGTLASQFGAVYTLDWLFQIYLWFIVGLALWGVDRSTNRRRERTHHGGER